MSATDAADTTIRPDTTIRADTTDAAGTALGPRFREALAEAALVHQHQRRKGSDTPYVSHLLAVTALVLEHGGDEDQAIAALFHDAVEDQDLALDDLAARYGERVAMIVGACTDTLTDTAERGAATWRARKERYIAHLGEASPDVLLVSASDKVHNARAILVDVRAAGMTAFSRFNAGPDELRWYYRSLVEIFGDRFPGPLTDELSQTVAEIEAFVDDAALTRRHDMSAIVDDVQVKPGTPSRLLERDPAAKLGVGDKEAGAARLAERIVELSDLQNRLWAESSRSVLLVLQGLDASGKDGTIRSVFTGVNPQGTQVTSFKVPTTTELAHDFLWRVHAACPARGEIGIFNRSHYEDLVTVYVKEIGGRRDRSWWKARVRAINEFERALSAEGTTILKVFLHVSKDEQGKRFHERMTDPHKAWKFRMGDLDDRKIFEAFMAGYDRAITETSTVLAPWHVVPADRNWMRNLAVAELLVEAVRKLDPQLPPPPVELANGALVIP